MPSSFKRASKDHKRGHSSANSYLLKRKYHSICQRLRYAKKTVHACSSVLTGSLVTRYSTSCELGWRIAVHHRSHTGHLFSRHRISDLFMRQILLSLPNLPQLLFCSCHREKEVILYPTDHKTCSILSENLKPLS